MWPANREHPHRGEREQGSAACGSVQGGALRSGGGARRRLRTSSAARSRCSVLRGGGGRLKAEACLSSRGSLWRGRGRCFDEFFRGSRSLLKRCNIAKKTPCDNAKKHPATSSKWEKYSHNDGRKMSYTREARHHTTACVPRGGLNSPTSDGTLEAPKAPAAASQKRPLLQKKRPS